MRNDAIQDTTVSERDVLHNPEERKFYTRIDGRTSYISYRRDEAAMDLQHTYVPEEDRGKGIAQDIVQAALRFAESEQLDVIPSCSYVNRYLIRNKEWQHLVESPEALDA